MPLCGDDWAEGLTDVVLVNVFNPVEDEAYGTTRRSNLRMSFRSSAESSGEYQSYHLRSLDFALTVAISSTVCVLLGKA